MPENNTAQNLNLNTEETIIETTDVMTGDYLGITQPSALYLIKQRLGDRVDLRFYSDTKHSRGAQMIEKEYTNAILD
jgi:HKD family nuclease